MMHAREDKRASHITVSTITAHDDTHALLPLFQRDTHAPVVSMIKDEVSGPRHSLLNYCTEASHHSLACQWLNDELSLLTDAIETSPHSLACQWLNDELSFTASINTERKAKLLLIFKVLARFSFWDPAIGKSFIYAWLKDSGFPYAKCLPIIVWDGDIRGT